MTGLYYILDGKDYKEADFLTWAKWTATADRHVADDIVNGARISTVFLGLNHNYVCDDYPILFETLIFGGTMDGEMFRYETWEQAERTHIVILNAMKKIRKKKIKKRQVKKNKKNFYWSVYMSLRGEQENGRNSGWYS